MTTITLQQPPPAPSARQSRIVGRVTGNAYGVNQLGQVAVDTQDAGDLRAQGWMPIGASGTSAIDFGSFPGADFATVTVPAIDTVDPSAVLFGFVVPAATADHSADEHLVDPPLVAAVADGSGNVVISGVPGVGFRLPQPGQDAPDPMPYGKWTVGYAFLR